MPKQNIPLLALNRGEISKTALARVDVEKLRFAAECQVNWLPWVVGPMQNRPGTKFIGEVLNDDAGRILPFVFSKLDTAIIELTPNNARVWVSDVLVTRAAVGTAVTNGTLQSSTGWDTTGTTAGCSANISGGTLMLTCTAIGGLAQAANTVNVAAADQGVEHGLRIVVSNGPVTVRVGSLAGFDDLVGQTNLDTGTHSLAFTPLSGQFVLQIESTDTRSKTVTQATIEPAGAMTLPTPWGVSDLANVNFAQSGDIIYVACDGLQQHKIERRSTHGWSVCGYYSYDGPFNAAPGRADTRLTPSGNQGIITLSSDRPYFQPAHVGCLFRMFMQGQDFSCIVGSNNSWSPAFRVNGVGSDRNFTITLSGTWAGTISLQRSTTGPSGGWITVTTATVNGTMTDTTGGTRFDNVEAWYRVGFAGSAYTSGAATIANNFTSDGAYGIVRVTSYTSKTSVQAEVISQILMSTRATDIWSEGQWSNLASAGWPTSVSFHEGRLGWYGQNNLWLSSSGNYNGFSEINLIDGTDAGDAGPIIETFGYGPVDFIAWGLSLLSLLVGREGSIANARSNTLDDVITPTNISVKDCSTQGAARIKAVKIGTRGIYVQQGGRRVYELSFTTQLFNYQDHDLTRLNLDIGLPGFVDIDIQFQPDTYIHFVRGDGQVALLLYDPEDDVECWTRYQTLGVIENVCVLPANDIEDHVYYLIKRTINGSTVRYLERLARRHDCKGGTLNNMADAYVSYTGVAASTMSGLSHLNGETVVVWADGKPIGNATVSGGSITFPDGLTHTNAVAGLGGNTYTTTGTDITQVTGIPTKYSGYPALLFADGHYVDTVAVASDGTATLPNNRTADSITAAIGYVAVFESAKLAYAAQGGTALNQRKKVDQVGFVAYDTNYQAIQFGPDLSNLDNLPLVENEKSTTSGKVWDQYDFPTIPFPGNWDTDSRLVLFSQAPYPAKIGGIVVQVDTSEKL